MRRNLEDPWLHRLHGGRPHRPPSESRNGRLGSRLARYLDKVTAFTRCGLALARLRDSPRALQSRVARARRAQEDVRRGRLGDTRWLGWWTSEVIFRHIKFPLQHVYTHSPIASTSSSSLHRCIHSVRLSGPWIFLRCLFATSWSPSFLPSSFQSRCCPPELRSVRWPLASSAPSSLSAPRRHGRTSSRALR